MSTLPKKFVYLADMDASIIQDIKYFKPDNFTGRPVVGYEADKCITLEEIALALSAIQKELIGQALSLKVFDGYRPQSAVDSFSAWTKDEDDQLMKSLYYPNISKADFFKLGYISEQSAHTRGSGIDLTLFDLETKLDLDMGTRFDFMDETSHPFSNKILGLAKNNRLYLRELMLAAGFEPLETEWWHFKYINEPYPDTYFNFPIK